MSRRSSGRATGLAPAALAALAILGLPWLACGGGGGGPTGAPPPAPTPPPPPPAPPPVTDIDGNEYETTRIGQQTWTAENLRVSRFRNGDPVPEARTDAEWKAAREGGSPAWSYPGDDPANEELYGRLYNDFAAADPRGLCPAGWHVPTDEEWKTLERRIGVPEDEINRVNAYAGDAGPLKSTRTVPDAHPRWEPPNVGATDQTGFSALPNGFRAGKPVGPWTEGQFARLGIEANYWTSTSAPEGHWGRGFLNDQPGIFRGYVVGFGFAIRCLED